MMVDRAQTVKHIAKVLYEQVLMEDCFTKRDYDQGFVIANWDTNQHAAFSDSVASSN